MTSRIRVPIWGLNKSVMISGDATKGAQIGTNLLLPDGSLATLATLAKALGVTAAVPNASPNISITPVLWSRILGIPNRVLQPPFSDDSAMPGVDGDAIPGPRGLQGIPGIGVPGDDGYMGSDGDQGAPGPAGAASTVPGPPGPPGAPIPADDGRDGYDGDPVPGPQGAPSTVPGPAGAAGPPGDDGFVGSDGDVAIFPSAPPSALIGLTAITGNATTTMRSDAAPALDQGIVPIWTGSHKFTASVTGPAGRGINGAYPVWVSAPVTYYAMDVSGQAANARIWEQVCSGLTFFGRTMADDGSSSAANWIRVGRLAGSTTLSFIEYGSSPSNPTHSFLGTGLVTFNGGVALGAPTGGNEGVGTVNAASGYYLNGAKLPGAVTQATVTLPSPAQMSHAIVVADASVSATSKIMLTLGGAAASAVNEWDDIDLLDMTAVPGAGQFTLHARFLNPISGPLLLNYMVG